MSIIGLSLSFIGSSYLPVILLTLILGFVALIINENNKFNSSPEEENSDWKTLADKYEHSSDENKTNEELEDKKNNVENKSEFEKVCDTDDSSHSHNEDKKGEEKKSKDVVKASKKKGCGSSKDETSGGCSTRKKKVEDVIILAFSNEEECATKVLDCLEDDVSCRIKLLNGDNFDIGFNTYKDAVDLCLILLTSEENIKQVESLIEKHATENQKKDSETDDLSSFSYNLLYINQESQDLKVLEDAFNNIGGKMWQASVTISEDKQKVDSQILDEFASSLLKDIKKSRKKCCGTSCKTKKSTDIEDLFPITTAVQT